LLRYFAVVGSALLGLLLFANYLLEPPAEPVKQAAAPKLIVQHDPQASLIERWRDDQAAMKAAERGAPTQAAAVQPVPAPVTEPAQPQAEPPQITAPASLTPSATEAELRAARHAKHMKAERARKARLARARARQPLVLSEQTNARRQDQYYYAQPRPAYAEVPRPAFGPFGSW
jgi:hypothetical protein